MQRYGSQTDARRRLQEDERQVASRTLGLPVLGCFLVATVSFGFARIHASGSMASGDHVVAPAAVTTRVIDFKPQAFAPSAYADWTDQ